MGPPGLRPFLWGLGCRAEEMVHPPSPSARRQGDDHGWTGLGGGGRDALEGKGRQSRPLRRLGRRLEEVVKAVGGGYCRLQMPLKLALGVRGTVAGRRLGALEGGGGGYLPPFQCIPRGWGHSVDRCRPLSPLCPPLSEQRDPGTGRPHSLGLRDGRASTSWGWGMVL